MKKNNFKLILNILTIALLFSNSLAFGQSAISIKRPTPPPGVTLPPAPAQAPAQAPIRPPAAPVLPPLAAPKQPVTPAITATKTSALLSSGKSNNGFFIGLGAAYKEYNSRAYEIEIPVAGLNISTKQNLDNEFNFKLSGTMPVISLGYNFSIARVHFDYYPTTKLKFKYTGSSEGGTATNEKFSISEFNLMFDYAINITDASRFYIGLGGGGIAIKVPPKDKISNSDIGALAELGFIYSINKFDLGLGLKSNLTDMKYTYKMDTYNALTDEKEQDSTVYAKIKGSTAEIFVAYVF